MRAKTCRSRSARFKGEGFAALGAPLSRAARSGRRMGSRKRLHRRTVAMRSDQRTNRQRRWQLLKQIGEIVGGVLMLLAIVVGGIMLPGFMTDSASTVGPQLARAAHR